MIQSIQQQTRKEKRTCVLAVLQAGLMALETLAFSATFPLKKSI
jgi:hypothetical protein